MIECIFQQTIWLQGLALEVDAHFGKLLPQEQIKTSHCLYSDNFFILHDQKNGAHSVLYTLPWGTNNKGGSEDASAQCLLFESKQRSAVHNNQLIIPMVS